MKENHFSNSDIDAIKVDAGNNYFTPILEEVLGSIKKPNKVCDVGCGNGVFSNVIKTWIDCQIVGVDGSEYALSQAKLLNFDELHLVNNFSFDTLPFDRNMFDLVINKDVLEHLLHPEYLVREIARITSIGGHALIHVPNHFPMVGRIKLLFKNTIDAFNYFPEARRWNFPHIRFYNQQDLLDLIIAHGFQVIKNYSHNFFTPNKIGKIIPKCIKVSLIDHFPDAFAGGYTFLFKKKYNI